MIQLFLTLFIFLFAPIPWVIIGIHYLIKSGRWNLTSAKMLLIAFSLGMWMLLGYLLFNYHGFLFANQFHNFLSKLIGIIVLLCALLIEFLTHKALGTKRILGSSEFKQRKDKLITHGIYKFARHPRYIEHPLWALGLGLTFGYTSFLLFFMYLLMSFMIVAYFEEQELIKRYGNQYLQYKRRTPAFFIGNH